MTQFSHVVQSMSDNTPGEMEAALEFNVINAVEIITVLERRAPVGGIEVLKDAIAALTILQRDAFEKQL